jgi:two-component system, NtrC family, response regulator AtoC
MVMARILIADSVSERRSILSTLLRGSEHFVIPAKGEEEAMRLLREVLPELLIAEGNLVGAKILAQARELQPNLAVIMLMAGPPSIDQVVELMNQGVNEVLVSPLDINDVQTKVETALSRIPSPETVQIRFRTLVGSSPKMQQVFRKVIKVAAGNSPVLILGEKGTGKQLLAEQIHNLSSRKDASFDSIVCSSFSEPDLAAELFGEDHSSEPRRGRFQSNDGGTLYLADVSVMPVGVQGKLVRFLEEGLIQPPGTGLPLSLDLRVVTSNSEPMNYLVQNGGFRSDLFYALSASVIELPPLRARVNDIPELVDFFLGRYDVQIAGEAVELLMNYAWPGNIDELKNAVDQAVNVCEGNRIELRDIPTRVLKAVALSGRRHKYVPRPKEPGS